MESNKSEELGSSVAQAVLSELQQNRTPAASVLNELQKHLGGGYGAVRRYGTVTCFENLAPVMVCSLPVLLVQAGLCRPEKRIFYKMWKMKEKKIMEQILAHLD